MGDSDPAALFGHVAAELGRRRLGFLFVREIWGADSLLPMMKRRFGGPVVCNELMTAADAAGLIGAGHADLAAFGRDFVSNPDLVARLRRDAALTPADTATLFTHDAAGYTDYLTHDEILAGRTRIAAAAPAEDLGRYLR